MAELRSFLEQEGSALGLKQVQTYIQSGNILFQTELAEAVLGPKLEAALTRHWGFEMRVILRGLTELAAVEAGLPFEEALAERPKLLHVCFLTEAPGFEQLQSLDALCTQGERFVLQGRELYLGYPQGSGRSKLVLSAIEKKWGVCGTARNWKTVCTLLQMLKEMTI